MNADFPTPLMSVSELAERLPTGEVLVVDCRKDLADPARGEAAYREAHIPGAVYADLDTDLSGPHDPARGRHPLPTEAGFSAALSRWGWRPGLAVVAYDDANGALAAARLWWLLRPAGGSRVAVLDGAFAAWKAAGLPLESGDVRREPTAASVTFDHAHLVDFDELERARAERSIVLLDARAAPRYRGEVEPLDRAAGHIPGARNRPFSDNLAADGCFKSPAMLREEFRTLIGETPPSRVVHSCGSGVTACHNLLAMEHAGLVGSRLFAPSWSGWVSDPARPIAVGAEPG